jgi:hypothetical protein
VKKAPSVKAKRATVPDDVRDEVLRRCRRRCCMCFGLRGVDEATDGQIAHLDRNPSNAKIENLAYLCLECHKNYDMKGNRVQSYTPGEIGVYRDLLYRALGRDQIEWTLTIRVHRSQYDSAKKRIDKAKDLLRDGGVDVILNESPVE